MIENMDERTNNRADDEQVSEDSVEFRFTDSSGNARTRVLRGAIIAEDDRFIRVRRRDGDWDVAKSEVITIRRAVREGAVQ